MRLTRVFAATAALALALCAASARAQDGVDQRYATWAGFFAHGPISGNLWFWADVQPRFYDSLEPQSVLVRPGLSWRAQHDLFLTVGYAWVPQWTRTPEPHEWGDLDFVDEHRVWEQLNYTPSDAVTGLAAQFRFRLEQRFRTAGPSDVGLRLRVMVRGQLPLDRARRYLVVAWDEAFVALNDAATWQQAGFDQNRFFLGLGWQAVPAQLRFELGYVNQWLMRDGVDPMNHIAALFAFLSWN